jgi:hypothetical protein
VVSLPVDLFETAKHPSALLLAHGNQAGDSVWVSHRRTIISDHQLKTVSEKSHRQSTTEIAKSLAVPYLNEAWEELSHLARLGDIATVHRGIEWEKKLRVKGNETGYREVYVQDKERENFAEGLAPLAKPFFAFESPPTKFLCVDPAQLRRGAHVIPKLGYPKIILNAKRKSTKPWRLAAFADYRGLAFYQTFTGVWPKDSSLTTALTAVLNGPVANAFVASHEIRDNTNDTFEAIPVPCLSREQCQEIEMLVRRYLVSLDFGKLTTYSGPLDPPDSPDMLLRTIDALVLDAYDLPPKLERELLDFFGDSPRQVPFEFHRYFPSDFKPCFPLREYLAEDFHEFTAGELRKRTTRPPEDILKALEVAAKRSSEESR